MLTLTTDFGLNDTYVGAMKGVILSRLPDARIVDLTHAVPAQSVLQGAWLFETAWRFFPPGTVHVVVVDPGVGSARRRIAIAAAGQLFVGPDNGCLSGALTDEVRGLRPARGFYEAREIAVPEGVTAVSIEDETLFLSPRSHTFEGRDVFAPTAAYLAGGGAVEELGQRLESVYAFPAFRAPAEDCELLGRILHVDRFGNLISDLRAADLPDEPEFVVGGRHLSLARTYAEAGGLSAIVESSGHVEIALPGGDASASLGLGAGDRIVARSRESA